MKTLKLAMVFAATLGSASLAQTFGPLVEPALLAGDETATLVDIRGNGFDKAHAVGAVHIPYGVFRGSAANPGGLVDVDALEMQLELRGLELDDTIVIISDGLNSTDFGAAARVYWTLKSTGFSDLSILNGGHAAWVAAGLPTSNDARTVDASDLSLEFNDTWLATTRDVEEAVAGGSDAILVDARLAAFYEGQKAHAAAKRPGTLPNAINHAFTQFFEGDSPAMSTAIDQNDLKAQLGVTDGQEVVSFCNTGHWAASHWFAVSEIAGVENAKLYAGSMVEYSNADLPMANVPGLLNNALRQLGQ
jgi:thiosulfate/3-mercaptopyruvate sulfurtransferase